MAQGPYLWGLLPNFMPMTFLLITVWLLAVQLQEPATPAFLEDTEAVRHWFTVGMLVLWPALIVGIIMLRIRQHKRRAFRALEAERKDEADAGS